LTAVIIISLGKRTNTKFNLIPGEGGVYENYFPPRNSVGGSQKGNRRMQLRNAKRSGIKRGKARPPEKEKQKNKNKIEKRKTPTRANSIQRNQKRQRRLPVN